jgi:hypothetical protein
VVGKIVHLRKTYHFGPAKIAMYLKRYHDLEVSTSGVWRILKRLEMNRLPASQRYRRHVDRWKRYEKPQPGHRVQIDVKFVAPLKGSRKKHSSSRRSRLHPDPGPSDLRPAQPDHRDPVRGLRPGEAPVRRRGDPDGHGPEFGSQFHYHVLDKGIGHVVAA